MKKLLILTSVSIFSLYNIFGCSTTVTTTNPTPTATVSAMPTTSPTTPVQTATPTASPSGQYDYLIEKARNLTEISECINHSTTANEVVRGSVEVTGTCIVQGFTKKVTFTASGKCPDGQACPTYLKLVATASFDCSDNVNSTQCLSNN
jgi:hypothetical protein